MKKTAGLLLVLIGLLVNSNLFAQADVTVTVQINPPYSPYLSTYADQPNKLLVSIINPSAETYSLKLWVQITGDNGVSITTKPDFNPTQAINVGPFENKSISFDSYETHDYFDVSHVSLVGITQNDLIQNQALPEGNYQICVHALDYEQPYTQRSVDFCASLPVYYIDPPLAIQPTCGNDVFASSPQFVLFSWTPPATAPGLIQYEFSLKAVPNGLNPNDVIKNNTFPTIFNTTQTANTVLPYTVAMPNLELDKKYVWRVKVSDPSNSVQFKNGGYSEACSFTYTNTQGKTVTPISGITLQSPKNGAEIEWKLPAGDIYGHYDFEWVNLPVSAVSFHTKIVKVNSGQTNEDAIAKNPDFNQADKGEPIESPFRYNAKFEPGTYAWQVTTNDWNPAKVLKSDIWQFTVPAKNEADFSTFNICGYDVHVATWTNKDIDNLGGTGYLYLWDGAKVDVTFSNLTVRHCGLTNGKKTDWRVSNGYVGGDIKGIKPVALNPKEIEGDFELTLKSFSLTAALKPYYDTDKGYYIVQEGDKGEGCKRNVWCSMIWHTPFTKADEAQSSSFSFNGLMQTATISTTGIDVDMGSQNLILMEPGVGKNSSALPVFGSMMFEKDVEIIPDYPRNCKLKIEKGCWLSVTGKDVSAYLNGKFSMWNGRTMYIGQGTSFKWYDEYSFGGATSLLLKLTPTASVLNMSWNKNGTVFSNLQNQQAWAVLGEQAPEGVHQKGIAYPDIRIDIKFPNNTTGFCSFKNLMNKGEGYYLIKDGDVSGDAKFNAFKSKMNNAHVNINGSKLFNLIVKGNMEIPFINANAPFTFIADYDGVQPGYVDLAYEETTVFEKGNDKITCTPTYATVSYDHVNLNGDFNFINTKGKNVNAMGVHMKDIVISANGDAKTSGIAAAHLDYTVNGSFNGFPYKLSLASVDGTGSDKHYEFYIWGGLTLEEETLTPKTDFNTTLSFYQDGKPLNNTPGIDYNNQVAYAGTDNDPVVSLSPDDNSLDVKSGSVCATVYPNGLGSFSGCFKYFKATDAPYGPVYGDGFIFEDDVTFNNPMKKTLHSKVMVGKKDGYRYWFMAADQQGFAELPTGVLDIVVTGFGGRVYYHMDHPNKDGNITNDNYVPSNGTKLGLYGNALIKTAGSNGQVLWGNLATEIQTTSSFGLKQMTQFGEAYILSSGVNKTDAKIYAAADFTTYFTSPRYLEGTVYVKGNVYDLFELDGTAYVKFSNDDWHIYAGQKGAPLNVYVYPVGKKLGAYFTIKRSGINVTLGAGVSGELYGFHVKQCKCLIGLVKCACKGCYHADVALGGSVDATATLPSLQLGGSFSLTGSAGMGASICGIDLDPSISATFSGAFAMPHPFCLAGNISLHTPSPFPDFGFSARWKDGAFEKKDNCN